MWFNKIALLVLGVLTLSSCATRPGVKVSSTQYPFLKHSTDRNDVRWYRDEGPDFEVFYGESKSSKSAGLGFYLGGYPDFHPTGNEKIENGKLGIFSLQWHETVKDTAPKFYRTGLIAYKARVNGKESPYTQKIHVWIYGETETEVQTMADYAGSMALFAQKPADELREFK
jgi:hypothetical protein